MALVKGKVQKALIAFLKEANANPSKDIEKSSSKYAEKIEELIYSSIKDVTITIPAGAIVITGTCSTGPTTGVNPAPVVVQGRLSIG